MPELNRYSQIIEDIFLSRFKPGKTKVPFERKDMVETAKRLNIDIPKNIGDIIYSFRYRVSLPESIVSKAPEGKEWIIRSIGTAKYCFVAIPQAIIQPNEMMAKTKVPDATPGIISRYALNDEQALLAKLRYNRLIDIFTSVTCYSLQNHLRTTVPQMGQIETDEIYIGIDKKGIHYVFPVQAKGGSDALNIVQIEQDIAMCKSKFSDLVCRAIGAQFMQDAIIALFEFIQDGEKVSIISEKHYRLVPGEEVTEADLAEYQRQTSE